MECCCLALLLTALGPRLVLLLSWVFSDWYGAFQSTPVAILGWIFAPWTSLAWMLTFWHNGGEISGLYLIIMVFAVLADLGAQGGGARYHYVRRTSGPREVDVRVVEED